MVLLWLLPALVVTLAAMLWVGWAGRERTVEVDRDEELRRLGEALQGDSRKARRARAAGYVVPPRGRERSSAVAVRRPPRVRMVPPPPVEAGDAAAADAGDAAETREQVDPPAAEHGPEQQSEQRPEHGPGQYRAS